MKITKSQLRRIIKEELKIAIKESDDWYDDEKGYETVADRMWADQQAQRPYRTGVPEEDVLAHGLNVEKYPTTPEELESNRIAQELEDAWVAAGNPEARLGKVDGEILDMAMAVRDGDMTMEDAKQAVRGDLIGLPEGKAGKYGKGKGVPKDATKAEKEEQKRRDRHKAKQDLQKDELGEGKPSGKKHSSAMHGGEWDPKMRKRRGKEDRAASKEETKKMKKLRRGGEELDEIIREMIDEVADEELSEKCKESGCATPEEVAEYGDNIDKGAKNRKKIRDPYAVAWKVAKQKGSIKGPKIAGRVPGYKKGK
jgi:hypothetical protein